MTTPITSFTGKHAFLSNFWPAQITIRQDPDVVYPSVEHAYQASKFVKAHDREKIRLCTRSGAAKTLAAQMGGGDFRDDGRLEEFKQETVLLIVMQKFRHAKLRKWLLETGDAELIEGNTWGDTYWGVCNGIGENRLGKILMNVRDMIKRGAL